MLVDLLVELVRASSAEPLAILIEDAHWIDSASALLVEQIAARLQRPLVVLTARPEAEHGGMASLRRREALLRIDLAALETAAVAALAESTCGGPVDGAVVAVIGEQTQGNPLFVEEYVRELRDTGALVFDAGQWRLTGGGTALATAPATLQGVIASRIDGLSPDAQAALRVASVIGQQIDLALLADVLGRSQATDLPAVLAPLTGRQLVVADPAGREGGVRFAHALIQAVAYDSLLFERRKDLHRAVAEAIERREHTWSWAGTSCWSTTGLARATWRAR